MVGQQLQSRLHLRKYFQLMPGMQKHFETLIGQVRRLGMGISGFFQGLEQHAPTQGANAVLEVRLDAQDAFAYGPQMFHRHRPQVGRMFGQPCTQYGFGADDDGGGVPQGVVEVEGDQLNAHESSPLMRLALGWALS
ncbi:hypothetical protein D3C71_1506540 [compost metagenome]